MALGLENKYPILRLQARSDKGRPDAKLNKQLSSFVGQGKFNDPRSLRRGHKGLRRKLTPIYLRAAELATMYYANEREFTAFDDEFN